MGWGRTLLLGDIGNRLDIADAEQGIGELRRGLHSKAQRDLAQDERLAELESENEQLTLYLASLVKLLVGKGVLSKAEFATLVDLIEPDDGLAGES